MVNSFDFIHKQLLHWKKKKSFQDFTCAHKNKRILEAMSRYHNPAFRQYVLDQFFFQIKLSLFAFMCRNVY